MEWVPVDSSNLDKVRYYNDSMTLEVAFKGGAIYQYFDVPEAVYDALLIADSKGTFFNQQIKGSYRYARV